MLVLLVVQQIAVDNASKAQKPQARYYNASRRKVRYNLGDKIWMRNRVLSTALQSVDTKLAPLKFVGPYTIAAQLGPNVYDVVNQNGKCVGKAHAKDLKPFHGMTASKEKSEGEQAEAIPSEISEERNASFTSHSINAEVPEAKAHPRNGGRPRKPRLWSSVDERTSEYWSQTALTSDARSQVPVTQYRFYLDHAGDPQVLRWSYFGNMSPARTRANNYFSTFPLSFLSDSNFIYRPKGDSAVTPPLGPATMLKMMGGVFYK